MPPTLAGDAQAEAEHNAAVERIYERSPDAQADLLNMLEAVPNAV